jgi:Domain of unknown function (DUF4266)
VHSAYIFRSEGPSSPRAPAPRPGKAGPLRLGVALLLLTVGGCSTARWTVKPHQRELLADRIMQPDGDAQETAADAHVLSNREGAIGGSGTSGGGCGCN